MPGSIRRNPTHSARLRHEAVRRTNDNQTMLGTDKSRGYCLEMICADFLAGATLTEDKTEGRFA